MIRLAGRLRRGLSESRSADLRRALAERVRERIFVPEKECIL